MSSHHPQPSPSHRYNAIHRPHTYPTLLTYACGHQKLIPITFLGRAHEHELAAARSRAAAQYRYRWCRECRDRDCVTVTVLLLEQAIDAELERLERELRIGGDDEDYGYYALGDVLCRIWALHAASSTAAAAAGGAGVEEEVEVKSVVDSLMNSWARLAIGRLRPAVRGKLLFAIRMETGDDEAVQWVAERMGVVEATTMI